MSPTTKAPPAPEREHTPVDPRIRARRIEVRRGEGRRRLHRLGAAGIAVAVIASMWWLTLTPLFDVDAIRVRGATNTGEEAVIAAIGIARGDALLTADIGGAARRLAALPWVETVDVRRSWPGTVAVDIVERTPLAAIAARGGGWVLVDRGGRQLAVQAEPAVELVRIAGRPIAVALAELAGERYQGALDLAAVVPPSLQGAVAALWPQRDGALEATVSLPGGATATARFGAPDQLEAKLVALAAVLERADLAHVQVIDLRVPESPALTRA